GPRAAARLRLGRADPMNGDQTTQLQGLLDLVNQGDETARRELINRAYPKLHRLAGKILRDYPGVRQHEHTSDIVSEASYRLYEALKEVKPSTVRDFLRLAACRMRWILLDLAKKQNALLARKRPMGEDLAWPERPSAGDSA